MRLLVNLVLATALVPVAGIQAQMTATRVKPVDVTRFGAAAETVVQSRLSGLTPEARAAALASLRQSPVRSAESVEAATAILNKIPELKVFGPAIKQGMTEVLNSPRSTAFDQIAKSDALDAMAALGALAGKDNCSLREEAQKGGAVSLTEQDRQVVSNAAEDLKAMNQRSEFFDALPSDAIVELNETLDGLDISQRADLRDGSAVLVRNLNAANEALVARFSEDGVISAEEARKIADCQILEAGKRIAVEQGLPVAKGPEIGVELARACNFGDSLSESADKVAVDAYIARCN